MFNGITNIFKPPPVRGEAQGSDTRQEIKRHDPDQERKKKDKREKTAGELFGEDGATVSVDALHVFLENFLKSLATDADNEFSAAAAAPEEEVQISQEAEKSEEKYKNKPHGMAAQAAQAYQSMSQKMREPARSHILADSSLEQGPEISLGGGDVRIIHRLLEDLKVLEARDIHYLRIEKGDSFLQSIVTAVAKAS